MTRLDRPSSPSAAALISPPKGASPSHTRLGDILYTPSIDVHNQLQYQHTRIPHDCARPETSRQPRIAGLVAQTAAFVFSRPHGPQRLSPSCFLERRECIGRVMLKPADPPPLGRRGARQRVREEHASSMGCGGEMGCRDWLKCASAVELSSDPDTRMDHHGEWHGRTRDDNDLRALDMEGGSGFVHGGTAGCPEWFGVRPRLTGTPS